MSTRTAAGKLEDLIEQANKLEDLGLLVQGDDETAGLIAVSDLDRSYRTWFASTLTVLPKDLEEKFRFEFAGSFFQNRIEEVS